MKKILLLVTVLCVLGLLTGCTLYEPGTTRPDGAKAPSVAVQVVEQALPYMTLGLSNILGPYAAIATPIMTWLATFLAGKVKARRLEQIAVNLVRANNIVKIAAPDAYTALKSEALRLGELTGLTRLQHKIVARAKGET